MSVSQVKSNEKLNALNKKISEIKKKIQLSEGQRKANFEECDAKKRESAERIVRLKKEVKELQVEFAKAKNNAEATERAVQLLNYESSACTKKRNRQKAISTFDEDNIRLRKKLDLIKYRSNKQQKQLALLLQQYEELMNGKPRKNGKNKSSIRLLKKQIIKLENQLHRVSVMQMEADTVRKKYRSVRSSLKVDASFYISCLDDMEENIREQENEIKRLQKVKVEAIELRDTTKKTFNKQEVEALNTSKEREAIIQEFRKRVDERKQELERIERMAFSTARNAQRDDADTDRKSPNSESSQDIPQCEVDELEETFVKLRNATGVSRTEEVLDRFLAQKATREKLKKMQAVTEEEKMRLEEQRQQMTAEIEMQKFSQTKDADQTADKLKKLNKQIEEEKQREEESISKLDELQELLQSIGQILFKFYRRFYEDNEIIVSEEYVGIPDPMSTLDKLNNNINEFVESIGGPDKYNEILDQILADKMEVMSLGTSSTQTKQQVNTDDQPLFPLFPTATTPAAQTQPSEDEEEIPSRSLMKRQAQLLVDTKSRRKGFAFKR